MGSHSGGAYESTDHESTDHEPTDHEPTDHEITGKRENPQYSLINDHGDRPVTGL